MTVSTFTYKFQLQHSYTSHPRLSESEHNAISSSNSNDVPDFATLPNGDVIGLTFPYYTRTPDKCTKNGWIYFGCIKVKCETLSVSPDYHSPNGNGSIHKLMVVRSTQPLTFFRSCNY